MSQEKKYQVFISSTYTDLIEAREKATKVILDLYHLPVGMEMFSADDDDQWKIITDAIDVSDYYVLIIGHRYGSLTNKGISYTEKEFNYAKSKKIPIISFIRDRNVAVSNSDRELIAESLIKLDKFIEKAKNGKMCAFWTDVSDLERQIAVALPKSFARHKGIGWVRGDSKSEHIAEEIAKLSEENRKLREENELLKSKSDIRKPELKVYLNEMHRGEGSIVINFPILPDSRKFKRPEKRILNTLQAELLRMGQTISIAASYGGKGPEDFFDIYNDEIDAITDQQIEAHNECMQLLQQLKIGLLELGIKVENVGTAIATSVSVEIIIPDFIMIIDDDDQNDIKYFENYFNTDLITIETPEERSQRSNIHHVYRGDGNFINTNSNINLSSLIDKSHKNFVDDRNTIHLTQKTLLHSKNEVISNFHLFPIEHGNGVLTIKVMCAEYVHPEVFEIPITIE